jgi:hypothetical protein
MPDRAYGRLAVRLTVLKLLRSPATLGAALCLPALITFAWARESYTGGMRVFLYLLPHVFLAATQNMFKGEAAGGALENVLFIRGGFRRYFLRKDMVLSLLGCGYGLLLFAIVRVVGPGTFETGSGDLRRLAVSLLAGIYYVAFGGLLGHFLEGGSNVLALVIAQAAAFIGLLMDTAGGRHLLESLASGTFSGLGERLKFIAIAGVLPNILVADSLRRYALWLVPAAAALFLLQTLIVRGSEWRGR